MRNFPDSGHPAIRQPIPALGITELCGAGTLAGACFLQKDMLAQARVRVPQLETTVGKLLSLMTFGLQPTELTHAKKVTGASAEPRCFIRFLQVAQVA
jgi:hypothetical protein